MVRSRLVQRCRDRLARAGFTLLLCWWLGYAVHQFRRLHRDSHDPYP